MKDKQNIFYTSISKYYSEIFPYNPMQLKFVENCEGELNGKQILDIGCATGELASQLAKSGALVTAIDLNTDLLKQAAKNKLHRRLVFQEGNMLELATDFKHERFHSVLCFGNTLVHLQSIELVKKMLQGVFSVLKPEGQFLMQILNYDFIMGQQIAELPLIETENIKFIRKYNFQDNSSLIGFQTDLFLKKENEFISNETTLLALKSSELTDLLEGVGFKAIELYSNFKMQSFGGDHVPLVLSCRK